MNRLQRVQLSHQRVTVVDPDREKSRPVFLFEDEVAQILRMTTDGLAKQRRDGREPGALGHKVGGRIRYLTSDVVRYLEEVYGIGAAEDILDELKPPTKPPDVS